MFKKRVLFLSADPNPGTKLKIDNEIREIEEGLRKAERRDNFTIDKYFAVRPRDLGLAILEKRPHIIHFSGHGCGEKGLLLEDEIGRPTFVSAEALSLLFELFSDTECVILNACYSEIQAEAITEHVNYVIGMSDEIEDKAAIAFSVGFYSALTTGESIDFSYNYGRANIAIAGLGGRLIPVLKKKQESETILDADFGKLRNLLRTGVWKQADLETRDLILNAVGVSLSKNITPEILAAIPCPILHSIDKLWVELSNGNFGFSTQIDIYKILGRNQLDWAKAVGWRHLHGGSLGTLDEVVDDVSKLLLNQRAVFGWIPYDSLQFTLNAPKGHLPSLGQYGYGRGGKLPLLSSIENKLAVCKISNANAAW